MYNIQYVLDMFISINVRRYMKLESKSNLACQRQCVPSQNFHLSNASCKNRFRPFEQTPLLLTSVAMQTKQLSARRLDPP